MGPRAAKNTSCGQGQHQIDLPRWQLLVESMKLLGRNPTKKNMHLLMVNVGLVSCIANEWTIYAVCIRKLLDSEVTQCCHDVRIIFPGSKVSQEFYNLGLLICFLTPRWCHVSVHSEDCIKQVQPGSWREEYPYLVLDILFLSTSHLNAQKTGRAQYTAVKASQNKNR